MARPEMKLLKERKMAELVTPPKGSSVLEASGVIVKGGTIYVVFDNVRRVARIDPGLSPRSKRAMAGSAAGAPARATRTSPTARTASGSICSSRPRNTSDGTYKALIDECDEAGRLKAPHWIDFPWRNATPASRDWRRRVEGLDYLLALCEGNHAAPDARGGIGGGGRIQVLVRKAGDVGRRSRKSSCRAPWTSRTIRPSRCAAIGSRSSRR